MDDRKRKLEEIAAIVRRRCPRIAKDRNDFPDLNWCAEHLVRSFEKAEEAVFHSRQQEQVTAILTDLQAAIRGIEKLSAYNRAFLVKNMAVVDGDPDISKPALIGIGSVLDREKLFSYRLSNLNAFGRTLKMLNNRLRRDTDADGQKLFEPPVVNQTSEDYRAAMLAGGCRKIWHLEKQRPKPMRINASRNHDLRHFIDDVFDAFGLNDHVKSDDDKPINAASALDAYDKLTKDGKGVAL
ncbi:hypothetical protein [Aliiroseovarius marinus]|uniref:hypothetical protein n=1 Tax=Aliiroseovarius marinus TaxID=2500159 RepID=UPI002494042E|nr:hypothetical protein [Aliiroseovarius marinus]